MTVRPPEKQGLYDPRFEHDACGTGFIANIKGKKTHDLVQDAITILMNLDHRGAVGADPNVGDGAGILVQIPDEFLRAECEKLKIRLPELGKYGVGMFFFPKAEEKQAYMLETSIRIAEMEGLKLLGIRDVPINNKQLGQASRETQPDIKQLFFAPKNPNEMDHDALERKLFVVRRLIERDADASNIDNMWIPSMSARTLGYKGMLTTTQLKKFYPDLHNKKFKSALALVHSRYSTNTFPTWDLAQPFRFIAHNGEINTVRGNRNWMSSREATMTSELFGDDLKKLYPVITEGGSDSASLDNAIELLLHAGRPIEHVMMMLVPEAWSRNSVMDPKRRGFYAYHSTLMEPWDGPATVAFTDGTKIGASLDRNGLRPARYTLTKDDRIIFASETGVLPIKPDQIVRKGRLAPGKIILIDTDKGTFEDDEEVKERICGQHEYGEAFEDMRIGLEDLGEPEEVRILDQDTLTQRQLIHGYTVEDVHFVLQPMIEKGQEATGSMGEDTPLAVLSKKPRFLHQYFKQHFAQVTNPPIDPIREEVVMSLINYMGHSPNLLDLTPENNEHNILRLNQPILTNYELEQIRQNKQGKFPAITLDMVFPKSEGVKGLEVALQELSTKAEEAVKMGYEVVILSDRKADADNVPIPSLLAGGAVHQHLTRRHVRSKLGVIVEAGDVREVHHIACLIGYGVSAINPYVAFETIIDLDQRDRYSKNVSPPDVVPNYIKAIKKGLLKIFSKMGISTLQSYQGAQIFEAVGLAPSVVDKYFTGTVSRIGGITIEDIARESIERHDIAFSDPDAEALGNDGYYHWRFGGEFHAWNPSTISLLQDSVRSGDYDTYKEYAGIVNEHSTQLKTIRGLLKFKEGRESIPLSEVESQEAILKRFCTGAMSIGSISRPSHENLAIAMNAIGGKSNTGEGGEDQVRFTPDKDGSVRRSAIKQVASGRFGVTAHYLVNADEMQIKMAQGAKPGEGGQLPGHKVSQYIAKLRHSIPGVSLISPPPHHDIYSIEDLAQLIFDLKNVNPEGNVSVKLVSEAGVGTIAAGVSKGKADGVLISGNDGGTGASPLTSIKHAGLPWELGLAETQQTLVLNKLRSRIRVQTDGQLKTGYDVVIGALLGADEFGFATSALIASGCIMMRKCHLNTCPVGIATQDPRLIKEFRGEPEHVINMMKFIAEDVREIMASLGFRTMDEMIGRTDILEIGDFQDYWKASGLDLSPILHQIPIEDDKERYNSEGQVHSMDVQLDQELIKDAKAAIQKKDPVKLSYKIKNSNRTVGAMLSGVIAKKHGKEGLPPETVKIKFKGSAGQTFGGYLVNGIDFILEGDANDYVGKSMSGGRVIIYPPKNISYKPEDNLIIGNTVLYGATGGKVFVRGRAGERFCVRNSGVTAVIEGVGDHGCEYMTGGRVVVIGSTGRNFAAGMSGGIAYVYDEHGDFKQKVNKEMVGLEDLVHREDIDEVKALLDEHYKATKSEKAKALLADWNNTIRKFVKVMPNEYKRILLEETEGETIEKDESVEEGEEVQWEKLRVS